MHREYPILEYSSEAEAFIEPKKLIKALDVPQHAIACFFQDVIGQLFVFIVMTVAAAEAAVGLGIIIAIFRNRESLDVDEASILKL